MFRGLSSILFILFSCHSFAEFSLNDLDQKEFDSISKEFSANFMHTSVSPASTLGEIWGIEIGVVGGVTSAPKFGALVKEQKPTEDIEYLPHAGALAVLTIPFGITLEATALPEQTSDNVSYEMMSAAFKWTFSKYLGLPSLDMAVKAHYSSSELSYTDTISGVETKVTLDTSVYGAHLVMSGEFLFIEPYFGFGLAKGSMDLNSGVSIFNFTAEKNQSTSQSSSHVFAGLQLNLFFIHIGAEYSKAFGTDKYTGKVSFYF